MLYLTHPNMSLTNSNMFISLAYASSLEATFSAMRPNSTIYCYGGMSCVRSKAVLPTTPVRLDCVGFASCLEMNVTLDEASFRRNNIYGSFAAANAIIQVSANHDYIYVNFQGYAAFANGNSMNTEMIELYGLGYYSLYNALFELEYRLLV